MVLDRSGSMADDLLEELEAPVDEGAAEAKWWWQRASRRLQHGHLFSLSGREYNRQLEVHGSTCTTMKGWQ